MAGPKIVVLDIETSPIVAYVWSLFKVNIGLNQIVTEWSILSYCLKELGKKKLLTATRVTRRTPGTIAIYSRDYTLTSAM